MIQQQTRQILHQTTEWEQKGKAVLVLIKYFFDKEPNEHSPNLESKCAGEPWGMLKADIISHRGCQLMWSSGQSEFECGKPKFGFPYSKFKYEVPYKNLLVFIQNDDTKLCATLL